MILPPVAELLSRVTRRAAVLDSLEALRSSNARAGLSGLTDPAKALISAFAAAHLNRPIILLVDSNNRAEEFLDLARYFFVAFSRKPSSRVIALPAQDVLPFDGRSPHAQISERRGSALWRIAAGECDLVIVPVAAALMRLREPEFYSVLASRLEREQDLPQGEFLHHLARVGYERLETVDSPGEFAVRGGIVDVFSPETAAPVRLEFFGDTLESLREVDANTQRSLRALDRLPLLSLTDYPRRAELLERLQTTNATGREDEGVPAAFYPGWEFHPVLLGDAKSNLFELASEAVILEDEPEELRRASEEYRARLEAARELAAGALAAGALSEVP